MFDDLWSLLWLTFIKHMLSLLILTKDLYRTARSLTKILDKFLVGVPKIRKAHKIQFLPLTSLQCFLSNVPGQFSSSKPSLD